MKPKVITLENGLRIIAIPRPEAAIVTALVLVGTGSKYESKEENGLSHFLEHMCFKGTVRRPSAKVISEELDGVGAVSNAFTSHEYTGYYAKGSPKHLSTFIDVLSDTYLNSTFPEAEIQKEKGVIIEEINMYEDLLQHKVAEELLSLMYGDQPAGWPIIGNKETVSSFTRKDFVSYKKKHYHADNTVVAICGPIDIKDTVKKVEAAFSHIDTHKSAKMKKVKDAQHTPMLRVVSKQIPQAHMAIGFRSVPFRHPDAPAVALLATILGRGMSSRLMQKLREELGAVYYVHAEQDSFIDHGIFGIIAGIDKDRPNFIIQCVLDELKNLKEKLLSKEELTKAKEYTLGMIRLGLESTDDIAGFYATPLILKKDFKTPEQIIKEYTAVTAEDMRRVARKLFVPKRANIAILGPYVEKDIDLKPFSNL
jgi:predicted Zn-dependent peptidase